MSGVRVLVGTRKGAFVLTADGTRKKWTVSGPHFAGWEIYHVNHDVDADGRRADQQTGSACCPPAPLARIGKRA